MGGYAHRTYGARINWRNLVTPMVKALLIANTAVFALMLFLKLFASGAYGDFLLLFALIPDAVVGRLHIWQPLTYLFLHGGLGHLLINLLVLWMFGCDLERQWGKQRFLGYYLLCGVGAGCINIIVKMLGLGSPTIATVGASGAIYGLLMAWAVLWPDRQIWLIPFPVQLPVRVYVAIMAAIAFYGSLESFGDNVSHVSHLAGMAVGYFYLRRGSFLYKLRNRYTDWQRQRTRRRFEVYMRKQQGDPPSGPDNWVN